MDMTRVQRHGLRARCLHGANAVVLPVLLATGLALGDWLPVSWVDVIGGHDAVDAVHRVLGLVFVGIAALSSAVLWRGTAWLVRELTRFRAGDGRWPLAWLRHALAPGRCAAPFHAGCFDPLERLVLTVLLAATVVVGTSGVYLYFLPPAPSWVFLVAIRAHVYAAWLLIAMLAVHVVAGLGVLPTHRGLARAMFGDGSVPVATARRLWPGWMRTRRDASARRD